MSERSDADLPNERSDHAGRNPIHAILDAAGIPWRGTRADLARRFGIHAHPAYSWNIISFDDCRPIVEGLIWPLSAQAFPQFSPHLPATELTSVTSCGDDARANLRSAADQLIPLLGDQKILTNSNTVECRWSFGAATLRLLAWPPEMQKFRMSNPAQGREPRLATGCHLSVWTGFRQLATEEERMWLDGFVPVGPATINRGFVPIGMSEDRAYSLDALRSSQAKQSELEFIREPIPEMRGILGLVGHSANCEALVFCHRQLYLVAMSRVKGFRVDRVRPAKGTGGSKLMVQCVTDYDGPPTKWLEISSANGVEDLNDLARALSVATGKPYELGAYSSDE